MRFLRPGLIFVCFHFVLYGGTWLFSHLKELKTAVTDTRKVCTVVTDIISKVVLVQGLPLKEWEWPFGPLEKSRGTDYKSRRILHQRKPSIKTRKCQR